MAQTINIANIKVGYDIEELKKNGQFTRGELSAITRTVKAAETPFQKMAKDIALLDRAFAAGGISATTYNQAVDALAKKHGLEAIYANSAAEAERKKSEADKLATKTTKELAKASEEATRKAASLAAAEQAAIAKQQAAAMAANQQTMNSLKGLIGGYIGLSAAIGGIRASVKLAAEMEQTKIAFGVMMGSTADAKKALEDFKKLDVQSPINFADFAKAGKTMLQFGVSANQLTPVLSQLSAISLGNSEQFQSLSLAFGQVQANGRLMGQEVLQMVNAGFNPLQEISRTTGISMVELKKQMEAGGISAEMVAKAFQTATESGGRFYGMNQQLEQSLAGQFAKLEGDIQAMAIQIGTSLMPAVRELVDLLKTPIKIFGGMTSFYIEKLTNGMTALAYLAQGKLGEYLDILEERKRAEEDAVADSLRAEYERQQAMGKTDEQAKKLAEEAKQRAKEEKEREAEYAKQDRIIADIKQQRDEYDKLAMSAEAYAEQKRKAAGYSDQDLKIAENFDRMIKQEQERKKTVEEIAKIEQDMLSPKQKALDEMKRIQAMYDQLSPEEQKGSKGQALKAKQQEISMSFAKGSMSELAANIAPALKAGTVEAYQFMLQQNAKSQEAAAMRLIQQQLLEESRKANEMNRNAPRIQLARN
jgi:tape measure domain-containing protein